MANYLDSNHRYRLIDPENPFEGGFARVWEAFDEELERPVAVKRPKPIGTDFIDKFRREARRTAGFTHQNIVTVFGSDLEIDNPYVVMEFLPDSLAGLLERIARDGTRPGLSWQRSVKIALQVCEALDYSHKHPNNVVHRDVNPRNILLGAKEQVKVSDFGLAYSYSSPNSRDRAKMDPGGSVDYMPPEQWILGDVDHRADVYALGISLFQMIEGRVPFDGATDYVVAKKHEFEHLPGFSPDILVPDSIIEVLNKATAKNQDDRYDTAKAFGDSLRSILDDHTVGHSSGQNELDQKVTVITDVLKDLVRRSDAIGNPRYQALINAIEAFGEDARASGPLLSEALVIDESDFEIPDYADASQHDDSAPDFMMDMGALPAGSTPDADGFNDEDEFDDEDDLDELPEIDEEFVEFDEDELFAHVSFKNGEFQKAIDGFTVVIERLQSEEAELGIDPGPLPSIYVIMRGLSYQALDEDEKAINDFTQAILDDQNVDVPFLRRAKSHEKLGNHLESIYDFTEHINSTGDPSLEAYHGRGHAYSDVGEYLKATEDFTVVLDNEPTLGIYRCRGIAFTELEEYQKALEDFSVIIKSVDPTPDQTLDVLHLRSRCYQHLGEYRKAADDLDEAAKIDPEDHVIYYWRGLSHRELGQHQQAIDDFTMSISIEPSWEAHDLRGHEYSRLEEHRNAIIDFTEAIRISDDETSLYRCRANGYRSAGQYSDALNDINEFMTREEEGPRNYESRGLIYLDMDETQNAIDDFTTALSMPGYSLDCYYYRGHAYSRLGDLQTAIDDFTKSMQPEPDISDVASYLARGQAYEALGKHSECLEDFNFAIGLNPEHSNEALILRGQLYVTMGQCRDAIVDFDNAELLAVESDVPADLYRYRGEAYQGLNEFQNALEEFNTLCETAPDPDAFRRRGTLNALMGNIPESISDLQKSEELSK